MVTENLLPNRIWHVKCPVQPNVQQEPALYYELVETINYLKAGFAQRLFELRSEKGASARGMSLALGQGAGYVSNLENGHNLPSMSQFFAICKYLGVTPQSFFSFDTPQRASLAELQIIANGLSDEDLQLLMAIARKLNR